MKLTKILTMMLGALCVNCTAQNPNVKTVSPAEFNVMVEQDNGILLDVRKPEEFAEGHLKGAKLLNWLDEENFKKKAAELDKSKTVYVYCRSGRRSNAAARWLANLGFSVVDMRGGILAWNEASLPTTTEDGGEPSTDGESDE